MIYRPFQSKSLNHYLYFYIVMYKICITKVFCSNLSVKSETPILYLMLHALLFWEPVLERSVVPLWCPNQDRWHLVCLLGRWQRVFAFNRKLIRVRNASLFFCCVIIFLPPCLPQLKLPTSSSTQCGLSAATMPPPLSAMSSWCRRRSRRNVSVVEVKTM